MGESGHLQSNTVQRKLPPPRMIDVSVISAPPRATLEARCRREIAENFAEIVPRSRRDGVEIAPRSREITRDAAVLA